MHVVQTWPSVESPLTLEAVRARHTPPEWHRISQYHYAAGTRFSGTMKPATCYVVSGQCAYRFSGEVFLDAGKWTVLEGGDYELEVIGDDELVIVLVWKLPFSSGDPSATPG